MRWVFAVLTMLACAALGAEPATVSIQDFSLGINTIQPPSRLALGEALGATNIDLTRFPQQLAPRLGYSRVTQFNGCDSLVWNGIFGMTYSSGKQQLLALGDSSGVAWGNLYSSTPGTVAFGTVSVRDTITLTPDSAAANLAFAYLEHPPIVTRYTIELRTSRIDTLTLTFVDTLRTRAQIVDAMLALLRAVPTYPVEFSVVDNGSSLKIIAADSSTVDVAKTNKRWLVARSGAGISAQISTKFPITGSLQWTPFRDRVYITNGVSKAYVYDGRQVHYFPMKAPGEMMAFPLAQLSHPDGRYRYALTQVKPDTAVGDSILRQQLSYVSTFVVADKQPIMLTEFPMITRGPHSGRDSVTYKLWRSTGQIGYLDKADSIWYTGITVHLDSTNYATLTVIDTLSDSLLRAGGVFKLIADGEFYEMWGDSATVDDTIYNAPNDSILYLRQFKMGAPEYLVGNQRSPDSGIWSGGAKDWLNVAGYSWFCVAVDTLENNPSDSGRSFTMLQRYQPDGYGVSCAACSDTIISRRRVISFGRGGNEAVTLVMPRTSDPNVVFYLYRGPIIPVKYDSSKYRVPNYVGGRPAGHTDKVYYYGREFEMPDAFFVGQYAPGDTITDTLRYDSLITRPPYKRNAVPPLINAMIATDDRLFATDGSSIFISDAVDTAFNFNLFRQIFVGKYDGDPITGLWDARGAVRVSQNRSMYTLFRLDDTLYRPVEMSNHYGMVAPLSHAVAPEGDYLLSAEGIRLETEGTYRARDYAGPLMSAKLRTFLQQPIADLRNCFATYFDNKYLLYYPSKDSTFVLNKIVLPSGEESFGWTHWTVPMVGATKYRAESDALVLPGDSLYFIKPGDNSIYRYGARDDIGQNIEWRWQSGLLAPITGWMIQPSLLTIGVNTGDTIQNLVRVSWHTEKLDGRVYGYDTRLTRMDTTRFMLYELGFFPQALSWSLEIASEYDRLSQTMVDPRHPISATPGYLDDGRWKDIVIEQLGVEFVRRERYRSQVRQ